MTVGLQLIKMPNFQSIVILFFGYTADLQCFVMKFYSLNANSLSLSLSREIIQLLIWPI